MPRNDRKRSQDYDATLRLAMTERGTKIDGICRDGSLGLAKMPAIGYTDRPEGQLLQVV